MLPAGKIIQKFPDKFDQEEIAVRDLIEEFDGRSLELVILILAVPNLVPFINALGITHVTGALMLFFTGQMMTGSSRPWFPKFILNLKIKKTKLVKVLDKVTPFIRRVGLLMRRRMEGLCDEKLRKLYGFVLFVLTVILCLPIPFVNVPPVAIMVIILLGYFQHDGFFCLIGLIITPIFLVALYYSLMYVGAHLFAVAPI